MSCDYHQNRTPAVGLFPASAAPCGAEELSGNVWEWYLSAWALPYQYPELTAVAGTVARVARGGSWDDASHFTRAASRIKADASDRAPFLGLRVVLAPALLPTIPS